MPESTPAVHVFPAADAQTARALAAYRTILTWMVRAGRARLTFMLDDLDVERIDLEVAFPTREGTWGTWRSGAGWDGRATCCIGLGDEAILLHDRFRSLFDVESLAQGPWPRTHDGWLWDVDITSLRNDFNATYAARVFDETLNPEASMSTNPLLRALAVLWDERPTNRGLGAMLDAGLTADNVVEVSPWAPPASTIADTAAPPVPDLDLLAELAEAWLADDPFDPQGRDWVCLILHPLLAAFPGTPPAILEQAMRQGSCLQLLQECALVPESIAAQLDDDELLTFDEVVQTPGLLLPRAGVDTQPEMQLEMPGIDELRGRLASLNAIMDECTDPGADPLRRRLAHHYQNFIPYIVALNVADGWTLLPSAQDLRELIDELRREESLLKGYQSPEDFAGFDWDGLLASVRLGWVAPA